MAKKSAGKVKGDIKKVMAKVIIPIKSPKTGSYKFQRIMMPADEVKAFIA